MTEIIKRKSQQQQKPPRRQMVQGVQREYLLDAMKHLLSLNKKVINKKTAWENISNELNKLGPIKEPARWRKCWSDILLRLRKRILQQQEKYQIILLDDKNCYDNLKLSPDDIKILDCYGGIELLFKDCNRKTKDGRIETISITDSSENGDLNYDNQDDSQMTYMYNNNSQYYDDTSIPATAVVTSSEKDIVKLDIPEIIYENNNNNIDNNNEFYKKSRIIDDQMIVESNNTNHINNNNNQINENLSSNYENNEMNESISMVDHIKESLEIQKKTFEEIRRLGEIQQETNNLMRILIDRLTTSPPVVDNNEKNITEIPVPEDGNLSMLSVKLEEINHNGNI